MFNLKGKKTLITGATGGIGKAITKALAEAGAEICISGTNAEKLKKLCAELNLGCHVEFNLRKHEEIDSFITEVHGKLSGLDVVVVNAGITRDTLSIRMKQEQWQEVLDINLTATFLINKASARFMLKQKYGRIINISSVVAHTGNVGQCNYVASKSGIIGMSKSLALEVAKKGVTVNCVSPGYIDTPMTADLNSKIKEKILETIPLGKIGNPSDIASAVIYLASDEASYVTGSTLHVNGGMLMY